MFTEMTKIPNVPARKRQYRQYDDQVLSSVIAAIKRKEISINQAAKKFKIARGTLVNRVNNKHTNLVWCPLGLSKVEEDSIIAHIVVVSEWGFPFDKADLCHLTKLYLDKSQRYFNFFESFVPPPIPIIQSSYGIVVSPDPCDEEKSSKFCSIF